MPAPLGPSSANTVPGGTARSIADGVFDRADDPDDEFIFGLERILDGIEALISSR